MADPPIPSIVATNMLNNISVVKLAYVIFSCVGFSPAMALYHFSLISVVFPSSTSKYLFSFSHFHSLNPFTSSSDKEPSQLGHLCTSIFDLIGWGFMNLLGVAEFHTVFCSCNSFVLQFMPTWPLRRNFGVEVGTRNKKCYLNCGLSLDFRWWGDWGVFILGCIS